MTLVADLAQGLRRLTATNPSPMTDRGTNTYLIGHEDVALIDPGPALPEHLDAILAALGSARLSLILVTHSHLDHSTLAPALAEATGAPICAAGLSDWGRSANMQSLAASGALGGGEGRDESFRPDRILSDGEVLAGSEWSIEAVYTPGHMANHMSFSWKGALFSGDLVMGWSTSLVSPPDGDMAAFFASLDRLAARDDAIYYPGHGDPIEKPADRLEELRRHRRDREAAILEALKTGAATTAELAARIYQDTPKELLAMAERNVLAHLVHLTETGQVIASPKLSATAQFARL